MLVTEFGSVMEVKLMQSANAQSPILVTEFGSVMEVKLMQSANAQSPILVTEFGSVMEVKLMQSANTQFPMLVTEFGMVMEVKLAQLQFVAHIDNQWVAYNTVEKSYRGCFENVKSCRFNDFNFI